MDPIIVSEWFVLNNNSEMREFEDSEMAFDFTERISHLKLQKLLYFAHGIHLALYDKPLFEENFEAWVHGPVLTSVYHRYKSFGNAPIEVEMTPDVMEAINYIESDGELLEVLNLAYDNFAVYTAWQLRNMTHAPGSPWDITMRKRGCNHAIDNDLIKNYFAENVVE